MSGHNTRRPSHSRLKGLELAFAVAGAPLAWLTQINVVYPLTATPCFPGPDRKLAFPADAQWAFVLAVAAYVVLLALAVSAGILAWRLHKRFSAGRETSADHFEGSGIGRMRFLAFCGILLGVGFSGAILLNAFSLIVVPPCAI